MKALTTQEAKNWCEAHEIKVTGQRFLHYEAPGRHCLAVTLDEKPSRIIALANYLLPTWKDAPFQGALLWFKEWGIWDDYTETTGLRIVNEMRRGLGEERQLIEAPALFFEPSELALAHSFFLLPLLFGWDAFLVPKGKDYFVFVSHDEVACVVAKNSEAYHELYEQVQDWKPKESQEWYFKGTGIPVEHS